MSSLVVNTNLSAIQTLNDLNATNNSEATAISRLSSGLQIQNAATGPAQYVVSQSLESEANGYGSAISNAQDGVSMIQTVSGALSQISSILQTMEQLALTSANGATETSTALTANNSEFTDLKQSIDEIAKTTSFGTTRLLVGKTVSGTATPATPFTGVLQVGAFDTVDQRITLNITAVTATKLGLATTAGAAKLASSNAITNGVFTVTATTGVTYALTVATATHTTGTTYTLHLSTGTHNLTTVADSIDGLGGGGKLHAVVTQTKDTLTVETVATGTAATLTVTSTFKTAAGFSLTTATGAAGATVAINGTTAAQSAVTLVQAAIKQVDAIASKVGAAQNELNAIVSNLTVGQQNLQAADSQLVDVNMAQEMTTFSTDQILMQSGVSMLAQAQQLPSLVLKLMGG